jgi:gamma-glutamyltranspeptidase/glutathione hydrolase
VTKVQQRGDFGAVASTHWLATASAMSVLERGGNAFDAAVAGAFVLYVAEPDQNGPGGEVPIVLRTASDGVVRVICGQGPTPAAATIETFSSLGLDLIPGSGVLAACVPGAVDAWLALLERFGTWRIMDVLAPAIAYSESGVPVSPGLARRLAGVAEHVRAHWPTTAAVYLANGLPRAGDRLRNPALAATLARLVREGASAATPQTQIAAARRAWREGFVPETAFKWLEGRAIRDVEGRTDTSLLTREDWGGFSARLEEPLVRRAFGATVFKPGAWSQSIVLLEAAALLDALSVAPRDDAGRTHATVEALKLAFADREAWCGDPDFVDLPTAALLSDAYVRERSRLIGSAASRDLVPGAPPGLAPRLPSRARAAFDVAAAARATKSLATAGDTAHIDVADRHGNVVAAAPSGGWLQSSPVIPELGFPLGTRAQTMWLEEGLANSLAPGKRPRTTLSPSVIVTDDERVIACGSPGGDAQDQWTLEFLLRHLVDGLDLQAAVDAPTFQSLHAPISFWPRQARPNVLQIEASWDTAVLDGLRARDHELEIIPGHSQGWMCTVQVASHGFLEAAASERGRNGTAIAR